MLPEARFGESSVRGWTGHPSSKFPGKFLTGDFPAINQVDRHEGRAVLKYRDVTWSKFRGTFGEGVDWSPPQWNFPGELLTDDSLASSNLKFLKVRRILEDCDVT